MDETLQKFIISRISNIEDGLEYVRLAIREDNKDVAELLINVAKADFELLKVLLSIRTTEENKVDMAEKIEEIEKTDLQN